MKLSYILEELVSPIVTPFILLFKLQYRAPEIVDFLRNYTVDVQGVGDVCSFAQLDTKRAGTDSTELTNNNTGKKNPKSFFREILGLLISDIFWTYLVV